MTPALSSQRPLFTPPDRPPASTPPAAPRHQVSETKAAVRAQAEASRARTEARRVDVKA